MQEEAAPQPAPKTVSQVLGEIVWLMTQSPAHKQLFVGDLEWFCMPAILMEQFRIFYAPNSATPAAIALWARISEETEKRLMSAGGKLRPDEWRGGDRFWLIELIAPFGAQDEILEDLRNSVFLDKQFKYQRKGANGDKQVVMIEAEPIVSTSH